MALLWIPWRGKLPLLLLAPTRRPWAAAPLQLATAGGHLGGHGPLAATSAPPVPGCYQLASPRDVAQTRAQPGTEGQALLWNAWSQDQEQSGTCTPAPSPPPLVNYPAGGRSTARAPGILKASGQQAAWNLPP